MKRPTASTAPWREYLGALRRWLWLIILGALLAGGTALLVSWRMAPVYEASCIVLIGQDQQAAEPNYDAILLSQQLAKTYSEMLRASPVLEQAAARLGLSPADTTLQKGVSIELADDTQIIKITARHADPSMAARIANTIPEVFIQQSLALQAADSAASRERIAQEMQAVRAQIDAVQSSLDQENRKQPPSASQVAYLEAMLAQYRTTFSNLMQSYEDIRVTDAKRTSPLSIIEPARIPAAPILPRPLINAGLAGMLGALVATGAALSIHHLDDTLRSPLDAEQAVGLPTLATIIRFPASAAECQQPLMAADPLCGAAECYRRLRVHLSAVAPQGSRLLLITSPAPLEGKTTTVANLGISLAQSGQRVLLVDANLRHPGLDREFGLSGEKGLVSLLTEPETSLDEAIQETRIPGLRVLPAGGAPANPAEVLDWPEMGDLLARLKPLADYVLVDSPPVLAATDAGILARQVDGVLLVVEADKTRAGMLQQAATTLENVRASLLGVVINRLPARHDSHNGCRLGQDPASGRHWLARHGGSARQQGERNRGSSGESQSAAPDPPPHGKDMEPTRQSSSIIPQPGPQG